MATKQKLDDLLGGKDTPKKPIIRRGQGLKLSTEIQSDETPPEESERVKSSPPQPPPETVTADSPLSSSETTTEHMPPVKQSQNRTKAKSQNRTSAKTQKSRADLPVRHKRVNRGYKLREDLIKACKRIALEEDRKLYEVMEEALSQYLAKKG